MWDLIWVEDKVNDIRFLSDDGCPLILFIRKEFNYFIPVGYAFV